MINLQISLPITLKEINTNQKYRFIETPAECSDIVESCLIREKIIGLDCEGVYLSKDGKLTLIQVKKLFNKKISLLDGKVFIFDILKGGMEMFSGHQNKKGLKAVFENKKILKLIHDCRNDWDSLLYQFSVRLYNFLDTQEAYFVFMIFYHQEITLPISLMNFIENILNIKLKHKEKFKNDINNDPNLWEKRPIDKDNLDYAAEDVLYLIKAWVELREKFNQNMKEIVYFLSIIKVVDVSMFHQFREYLITNIVYINMLDNVFDSKEIINYIFSTDYIYNFLQIKLIWNEENENKNRDEKLKTSTKESNLNNNEEKISTSKPFFLDGEFKEMFTSEDSSLSLVKLGMNFKKKQKLDYFSLNKKYENVSMYNSSNSIDNESYFFNNNINNRKNSLNLNSNNNQRFKKKFIGNNISSFDNKEEQSFNNSNNVNFESKSKRKNTYTFGQGLKNYSNTEQSKNIIDEEGKIYTNINIKENLNNDNKDNSRSNSYEKLAREKKDNTDSNYKIQYKDTITKEEIKVERKRKISLNYSAIRKSSNITDKSNYYYSDNEKDISLSISYEDFKEIEKIKYNKIKSEELIYSENFRKKFNFNYNYARKRLSFEKENLWKIENGDFFKDKIKLNSERNLISIEETYQRILKEENITIKPQEFRSLFEEINVNKLKNEEKKQINQSKSGIKNNFLTKNSNEINKNKQMLNNKKGEFEIDKNKSVYELASNIDDNNNIKRTKRFKKNHNYKNKRYRNNRNYYYDYYSNSYYYYNNYNQRGNSFYNSNFNYPQNTKCYKNKKSYRSIYKKEIQKRNNWTYYNSYNYPNRFFGMEKINSKTNYYTDNESSIESPIPVTLNDLLMDDHIKEINKKQEIDSPKIDIKNNNKQEIEIIQYDIDIDSNQSLKKKAKRESNKKVFNNSNNTSNSKSKNILIIEDNKIYNENDFYKKNSKEKNGIKSSLENKEDYKMLYKNSPKQNNQQTEFNKQINVEENNSKVIKANSLINNNNNINIFNEYENIFVNNNFNINVTKENINFKKITFEEHEYTKDKNSKLNKKVIFFNYENEINDFDQDKAKDKQKEFDNTEEYDYLENDKTESIDINIDIDKKAISSNNTNINNYFNIILTNSSMESKSFKLEISVNNTEKSNKKIKKYSLKKKKIKKNRSSKYYYMRKISSIKEKNE